MGKSKLTTEILDIKIINYKILYIYIMSYFDKYLKYKNKYDTFLKSGGMFALQSSEIRKQRIARQNVEKVIKGQERKAILDAQMLYQYQEREKKKKLKNLPIQVKSISGLKLLNFFKVQNRNILIFGSEHAYCDPLDICDPCINSKNCYDFTSYIKKVAEQKCVDVFVEEKLQDSNIKLLQNLGIGIPTNKKKTDIDDKNYISNKAMNLMNNSTFSREEKEELKKIMTIKSEKNKSKFINRVFEMLLNLCNFNTNLNKQLLKEIVYIVYEAQFAGDNHLEALDNYIESLNDEQKTSLKNYFKKRNTAEEQWHRLTDSKNIRKHLWDLRGITKENKSYTPMFFMEGLIGSIKNLNPRPEQKKKYKKLVDDFLRDDIKNVSYIIYYLSGLKKLFNSYDDTDDTVVEMAEINRLIEDQKFYSAGKKIYIKLFTIFKRVFTFDIKLNDVKKIVEGCQELIKKQINKSIFKGNEKKFIKLLHKEYLLMKPIKFKSIFYTGMFITELYSLPRMFKIMSDPEKIKRNDHCNNQNIFKNIIYVGGSNHSKIITNFIKKYFEQPKIDLDYKLKKGRCIEFKKLTTLL